jgi:hypothetical protein
MGAGWLPGDFAVVHSSAVTGRLVHVLQVLSGNGRTDYEHVIVGLDGGRIVEAMPGGAMSRPFYYSPADVYWSTNRLPIEAEPTSAQRQRITAAAEGYAARRVGYSLLDYAAVAAHDWHVPAPGLDAYIAATGHMMCSQLTDQCYQDGGVRLFRDGRLPGWVRPCDLADLIGAPPPSRLRAPGGGTRGPG